VAKVSKFITVQAVYKKQVELANLMVLFGRSQSPSTYAITDTAEKASAARVDHLVAYVMSQYKLVSCFDDLKPFLEQLSLAELKDLLNRLGKEGTKVIMTAPTTHHVYFLLTRRSTEGERNIPKSHDFDTPPEIPLPVYNFDEVD
jgi:hypothetical protein